MIMFNLHLHLHVWLNNGIKKSEYSIQNFLKKMNVVPNIWVLIELF